MYNFLEWLLRNDKVGCSSGGVSWATPTSWGSKWLRAGVFGDGELSEKEPVGAKGDDKEAGVDLAFSREDLRDDKEKTIDPLC